MDKKYKNYLKSKKWEKIKISLYESRGRQCEKCGSKKQIHVHHKTYKNIFNEIPEDLELLCKICHAKEHGITYNKSKTIKYLKTKDHVSYNSYVLKKFKRQKNKKKQSNVKLSNEERIKIALKKLYAPIKPGGVNPYKKRKYRSKRKKDD